MVSVRAGDVDSFLARSVKAGIPALPIGSVGGDRIRMSIDGQPAIDESLDDAEAIWANAIGACFEKRRAIA